jgi:hypothetical protein
MGQFFELPKSWIAFKISQSWRDCKQTQLSFFILFKSFSLTQFVLHRIKILLAIKATLLEILSEQPLILKSLEVVFKTMEQ